MITQLIQDKIQDAVNSLNIDENVTVDHPTNSSFGDFSTNIAMRIAKKMGKDPMDIASEIITYIQKDDLIQKVEVIKPGFINIWLTNKALLNELQVLDKNTLHKNGKKVIVEYSSPNIAKPFTIGHLRSTVIGDAVANLLVATGWTVYRDNHLGDWGTQFGKQIYAIKTWGNEQQIENSKQPVRELVDLYVKFHEEAEKNPELENQARLWFKKLEDGDVEARELWQKCIQWSMKEFKEIYSKLRVAFTENPDNENMGYGESFFEDKMNTVITELKAKKLLTESKGAQLVFFPNDKYPPLMILKDDGATLYSTRDLATDKFRKDTYGEDITIINEVGSEQSLYFRQIYEIEQMLGWYTQEQRIHIGHGMYRFKDKKMSTRKGNVIWLEEVLNEAIRRASELSKISDGTISETSKKIGIGAIKWNDLKRTANQDVIFDWDDILNMQGNSGPYMQYTYVRAMSILKDQTIANNISIDKLETEESDLLRTLILFDEIISEAAQKYAPHILATYLYGLAQKFNLFYQKQQILKAESEMKIFRLLLTHHTAQVIKKGLGILGIETVEKM